MLSNNILAAVPFKVEQFSCRVCGHDFCAFQAHDMVVLSHLEVGYCPVCGKPLQDAAPLSLTTYAQRDPRWKDIRLGFGNTTIGRYGCVLCCLAMASERATYETLTPPQANDLIKSAKGYVGENGNRVRWQSAGAALGLAYEWGDRWRLDPAPVARIAEAVEQGKYVLLQVDFDVADDDLDEHWVLVREHVGDGVFLIDDPWTGKVHEFPPAYCRGGWDAARAIFGAVCFGWDGK